MMKFSQKKIKFIAFGLNFLNFTYNIKISHNLLSKFREIHKKTKY